MTSTPEAGGQTADPTSMLLSRAYLVLLVVAAVVGVVVSLAAWSFLELVYQTQQEAFHHLPSALGYSHGAPLWWSLPVLAIAGAIVAFAIVRLPGEGGHLPAEGLSVGGGPTRPITLPGVVLAGLASIGLGAVIGPEAPLIALGAGLAVAAIGLARRPVPDQAVVVIASAGAFAALSLIFNSPIIAAVILIEATGLGGAKLPLVLLPGLLAAGIGSLVSIGMGSFTGLSTSAYSLGPLPLENLARPDIGQFAWTIALSLAVALVARLIMRGGLTTNAIVKPRLFIALPLAGVAVAGLAIAFSEASNKGVEEVLFSGQDQLPGLISKAGTWSLSALALLLVFKGIAYAISLGSFRGGPTFPALFLGAAAGLMASHLPDFPIAAAVPVGIGAAVASILRLPLSAIVLASLLAVKAGSGPEPLVIVGVVVAYLTTLVLTRRPAIVSPPASPGAEVGEPSADVQAGHLTPGVENVVEQG
ncbi:MAG TPA: chloride channel protein [Solirubrobacteraceae bacterium]|nr:chloride channel protein [Solirubrobacteraceae bacterium]